MFPTYIVLSLVLLDNEEQHLHTVLGNFFCLCFALSFYFAMGSFPIIAAVP